MSQPRFKGSMVRLLKRLYHVGIANGSLDIALVANDGSVVAENVAVARIKTR